MEKCFFCNKIIIPLELITTEEIKRFFNINNIEFTLNYTKSKFKIGNKNICLSCEEDFRRITMYEEECQCEDCKKQREFKERFG
jgi:hypothetical protein